MWQDIENFVESLNETKDEVDPYFFGTVIIDCSTNGQFNLIDGQQRTTTFLLLLKALHLHLKESLNKLVESDETKPLKKGLENSYDTIFTILYKTDYDKQSKIESDWTNARGIEILENVSINELYKEDFRKIIEAETFREAKEKVYMFRFKQKDNKYTNFFRNFKFFYEKLENYSESQLNSFAYVFLRKCQIIEIKSWQIEQAIMMFNSLNSTGMPLSDADIISAQLYSKANKKNNFITKWHDITNRADALQQLKVVNIDSVLQQFMYIYRSQNKLYKKNMVTTPGIRRFYTIEQPQLLDQPMMLCESFEHIIEIWEKIIEYPIIKLLMKFNENFKMFLISYLFKFDINEINKNVVEPIAECLLRIFTLIELGNVSFSSSKYKTFLFNENLLFTEKDYTIEQMEENFNNHINEMWEKEDVIKDLLGYDKNVLVYLNEYLYAKEQNRIFDIDDKVNIEHIMPASGHNIEIIRNDANISSVEEFREIVNLLGNKILLEENINKSISNDWFKTKKTHSIKNKQGYKNSKYGLALDMVKHSKDIWEKEDIMEATNTSAERIANFIFNVE